jgi:TetR/AcrR family transcriptional regulator
MGSSALDASRDGADQPPPLSRRLSPGPGLAAPQVAAHQLARIHDATIQIVAERGYKNLKVRDVVRLAEVSTRAFYEHFASKEDCFLQTYRLISRRATGRIIAAQAEEPDWRRRPRLVFETFVEELEREPAGARLALIEAYAAGQDALAEAWRAERTFEAMLAEVFSRTPRGVVVPPLIVQGMVAGVATVSRKYLLAGRVADLANNGCSLVDWALCYPNAAAVELASLDRQSVWRDTSLEPAPSPPGERGAGDRALIIAATARLAAKSGYAGLTAPRIRAAAHVSRRKFDVYFDDLEDCYLAAIEQRTAEAMAQASRAQAAAGSWAGGVYRAIAALGEHVATDEFLAKVCLEDDFPPGPAGQRSRRRLSAAISELLGTGAARLVSSQSLAQEASAGAIWALFHRHVLRSFSQRSQISATLTYLALAPGVGASRAVAAIQGEQKP